VTETVFREETVEAMAVLRIPLARGAAQSKGTILAVRGAVVDFAFDTGDLPQIDEALVIE
jgi:hypothetical protein